MKEIILYFLFFFFICFSTKAQTTYTLNTTEYKEYYNKNCLYINKSYTETCQALRESSQWIPEGLPGPLDTIQVLNDDETINFVIPYGNTTILSQIIVGGNVNFIVEGSVSLLLSSTIIYSLSLSGNSSLILQHLGCLYAASAEFNDSSSIVQQTLSSQFDLSVNLTLESVTLNGNINCLITSSTTSFGVINKPFQNLTISGQSWVLGLFDIPTNYLYLSEYGHILGSVIVMNYAELTGKQYYLLSLSSRNNATVFIDSCPSIDTISACSDSSITISTTTLQSDSSQCVISTLNLADTATITFNGNSDIQIKTLDNSPQGGTLIFSEVSQSSQSTQVALLDGYANLQFNGNFTVQGGSASDSFNVYQPFVVNGAVELIAQYTNLVNFQLVPNLNIVIPPNGILVLGSNFVYDISQSNIIWQNYGKVIVDGSASLVGESFELNGGRILELTNIMTPSVNISNFAIASDSFISVDSDCTIVGSVFLNGTLSLNPGKSTGSLKIYGSLSVGDTGKVLLPQSLGEDFISTFVWVLGPVSLEGHLNITLGGKFHSGDSTSNYDVPVMNSTQQISGNFSSFTGQVVPSSQQYVDKSCSLKYKIDGNTMSVFFKKPDEMKVKWWRRNKWYLVGVAAGLLALIGGVLLYYNFKRRRNMYQPIQ